MIHFHGTPITPREKLYKLAGRHFCIPFIEKRDLDVCLRIGQSVMGDSGQFSAHTKGVEMDWPGYLAWLETWLRPPHWAVVPDAIDGNVEDQRRLHRLWRQPRQFGAAVWHLHLPVDWLLELADNWPIIAFGSSAEFWQIGTDPWRARIDKAWNALARRRYLPHVHMLRAMEEASTGPWPFASADCTKIARGHAAEPKRGKPARCPGVMAAETDCRNPPPVFISRPEQMELVA